MNKRCIWTFFVGISLLVASASRAPATTGGPDSFGYTYVDSNSPGGPVFDWTDIAATGTRTLFNSDDSVVSNIDLGFFFNFYGTDYSRVTLGNNGIVFSGEGSGAYVNQPIGDSSAFHGFIAPFWDDIVTWYNGAVYYQTLGIAPNRMFVVQWQDNQHYSSSPSGVTFQAILHEGSNEILFQYRDVDFGDQYYANNGASATVGIEAPTGEVGLQYSYNEATLSSGLAIRFRFPQTQGVNLFLSSQAPASKDHGTQMNVQLHYHNFGNGLANNVVLQTQLLPGLDFVSASGTGIYDENSRTVSWDFGTLPAAGHGEESILVAIAQDVPVGGIVATRSFITTSELEVRLDDNAAETSTRVTGSSLPPNTTVEPNNGGTTPSVYFGTPTTFSYTSICATSVDILIHINDGGPDIVASMLGGPPEWTYTTTFFPRHGETTVTYTVHGCGSGDQTVVFDIYIDPAGYIYDMQTGDRIAGASVWLQIPDGEGGWRNAPTGLDPAISRPDVNPLVTGTDGQYQWDVLAGSYRVHVEAPGYYPADSIVVSIPPPVFDLHVGLVRMPVLQPVSYPLIASRKISRTVWEYTYRFNIRNTGLGDATSVTATLMHYPAQLTVIDGDVSFHAVAAGGTVTGDDTFKVRIDRSQPLSNGDLTWQVIFTDPSGTSRTLSNFPLY